MAVTFHENRDFPGYWVARIESPYGGVFNVDPFTPLECAISHQSKGGKNGFGLKLTTGKNSRVLQVGTIGAAENFLREVKNTLSPRWFWKQDEDGPY